jgi:uncharacterized Ntn-hydrolase superfamily protein
MARTTRPRAMTRIGLAATMILLAVASTTHPASAALPAIPGAPAVSEETGRALDPVVATFSIAACDTADGIWGVAVASRFLAVGSVVPWARGGVGAVATQASANTTFGPRALDLLERGLTPEEVVPVLLRNDSQRNRRQVGIVDARGRAATYTGDSCMAWAGGKTGPGYAVQGNILAGPQVVEAMARSFERSRGYLGDRMMAALAAGDSAGGDSRGRESAAIRLAAVGRGYNGFNDVLCDLRVDDHADPLVELRRVYGLWRSVRLVNDGYRLVEEKKFAEAIALGEQAARLDPDSGEPFYHLACFESRAADADRAMYYLQWALRLRPALKAQATKDPDLAPLREREDFRNLVGE